MKPIYTEMGPKYVTNHSVRKTSISRLLDANTPENFVAQLSGHKNLQSFQSYKSASENHQRQISYVLSGETQNNHQITQASTSSQQLLSSNQLSLQQMTNSLAVNNASSPTALDSIFSGANISSISGCQFQIFKGPVKMIQQGNKRRYIIDSDDED